MKKKLCAMMLILGLVIAQIPGAGVITASAAGARNYLAASNGGNVHWEEATEGDAKFGDVYAGSQMEFADWAALPEGSSVNLTATPLGSNTFVGWYTEWNSTDPKLVSDSLTYTWTLPTESGTTLTAVFKESQPSVPQSAEFELGVTSGGSISGIAISDLGNIQIKSMGNYALQGDAQVNLIATPESDYTFKGWYSGTFGSSGYVEGNDGTLVSADNQYSFTVAAGANIALQAVFEKNAAPTAIPAVTVNVTPPAAGSSASYALSGVSVPSGEHYFLNQFVAVYDTEPAFDSMGNCITQPFTGSFEKDKTYYMGIALQANPGYMFQQGSESVANTTVTVNGATLLYGSDLWISNYAGDAGFESYGNIIFSFTPAPTVPTDIWIDETSDGSKAFIGGVVKLTGSGGTQAGYSFGTLVYSVSSIVVPYSEPKTAVVQAHIDAAYTKAYDTANACKNNGKSGEFSMSFTESTGEPWDNRVYKTFEYNSNTLQWEYDDGKGNTEVYIAPPGTDPRTRIHVASGDYGKYNFYSWEANGTVSGWDITVSNDGNVTASADLETSLAGATVTLTAASADSCYAFKEWQVVSGGAVLADSTAASTTFTMPGSDVEIKAVSQPTHTLEKIEKVDPTCTEPGTEAYWTCSVCKKMFSDEAGTTEITAPVAIPAGHDWGEWKVVKEATETEDGEEARTCARCEEKETRVIPKLVVEYRNTEGEGSDWKKGSDGSLTFVFKRSENDEVTFSHFIGIKVDGTPVAAANYDAVSGSVKITLKPGYLETLEAGNHTLTAMFDDGNDATANFTVTKKELAPTATPTPAPNKSPNTGDSNNASLWAALFLASLVGLYVTLNRRSRIRR